MRDSQEVVILFVVALGATAVAVPAASSAAGTGNALRADAPTTRILDGRLVPGADRRVQVRLGCSARRGCQGKLWIRERTRGSRRAETFRARRYDLSGRRGKVSVRLDRAVERKVERRGHVRARGIVRPKSLLVGWANLGRLIRVKVCASREPR